MVKNICKDINFLSQRSLELLPSELYVVDDLIDTLSFNINRCVGMAANMIGYNKRAIVFVDNEKIEYMINPIILKAQDEYIACEGCLSLEGVREAKRFKKIKVQYYDRDFKIKIKSYSGYVAQIIQHEMNHLDGIII